MTIIAEEHLEKNNPLIIDKEFLSQIDIKLSKDINDYPNGIIIPINKPYRWTSADVIRKIKYTACRYFNKKKLKVGHAGTLDPLATGVLLVCIGNACKLAESLQKHHKEYVAGISFGATTPSYDLEKEIDRNYPYEHITKDLIEDTLPTFLGEQEQIAPLFSAKSVDGVRAYELARKLHKENIIDNNSLLYCEKDVLGLAKPKIKVHNDLDTQAEQLLNKQIINIFDLELLDFFPNGYKIEIIKEDNPINSRIKVFDNSDLQLPCANIRIACTKGTYIRAFARDLGESLNSGAYLSSLQRSASGDFKVENSLSLEEALSIF